MLALVAEFVGDVDKFLAECSADMDIDTDIDANIESDQLGVV